MSIRPPSPAAAAAAGAAATTASQTTSSNPTAEPLPTTAEVPLSPSGKRIYPRGQNPGLRYAEPYYYPYKTYAKGRWLGRELVRPRRSSPGEGTLQVVDLRTSASLARGCQHRVPRPVRRRSL